MSDQYGKKLYCDNESEDFSVERIKHLVAEAVESGELNKLDSFCIEHMFDQQLIGKLLNPSTSKEEYDKCREMMLESFSSTVVDRCFLFIRKLISDKQKERIFGDRFDDYVNMLNDSDGEIDIEDFVSSPHWNEMDVKNEKLKTRLSAFKIRDLLLLISQEKQKTSFDNDFELIKHIQQIFKKECCDLGDNRIISGLIEFEKNCRIKCDNKRDDDVSKKEELSYEVFDNLVEEEVFFLCIITGMLCYYGIGLEKNYSLALELFLKLAELDIEEAQYMVGVMLEEGRGTSVNLTKAYEWFLKAAKNDHVGAQFSLGKMYEAGKGVSKDYKKAMKWYRKAALGKNANACIRLGEIYENGYGVTIDYDLAMKWYREAIMLLDDSEDEEITNETKKMFNEHEENVSKMGSYLTMSLYKIWMEKLLDNKNEYDDIETKKIIEEVDFGIGYLMDKLFYGA